MKLSLCLPHGKKKANTYNDFFNFIFLQLKFFPFVLLLIHSPSSSFLALATKISAFWELNVYDGTAGMCDGISCCSSKRFFKREKQALRFRFGLCIQVT